ncbi:hypothetical protein ABK040_011358 [Willaertia magna]
MFKIGLLHKSEHKAKVLSFLKKREAYCSMLVGNLTKFGALEIPNKLFSGDFYYMISIHDDVNKKEKIEMVFCHVQFGNLLFQKRNNEIEKDLLNKMIEFVIENSKQKGIPLKGVFGEYNVSKYIVDKLIEGNLWKKEGLELSEKENLYQKLLNCNLQYFRNDTENTLVRKLTEDDFDEYYKLLCVFEEESGLLITPFNEAKNIFAFFYIFGVFVKTENNQFKLISMCRLNSKSLNTGTIGAVFTVKEFRRKGYSQLCLNYFFEYYKQELKEMVLFTQESNSANNLYLKLGFEFIGHQGVFTYNCEKVVH